VRPKSGKLSNRDRDYIRENCRTKSPEELAAKLQRSVEVVLRCIRQEDPAALPQNAPPAPDEDPSVELRRNLKKSAAWRQLTSELVEDEIVYAEQQYVALMEQFREDLVLATEEAQIFKVIRLEVLKHRNAVKQKRLMQAVEAYERELERIARKGSEASEKELNRQTFLQSAISVEGDRQSDLSTEYVRLEDKHQKLMEALKATRQQRIDRIDAGKVSFLDLVKSLQQEEVREREGRQAKLMEKAAQKELKRLATPHVYADSTVDQPVLSSDTIGMLDSGIVSLPELEGRKRRKKAAEGEADNDGK
jgi:hypothetical protein